MLGRVLKEVKLPFPDDFFPEMELSPQLVEDFHHTASRLLQQTLEAERPVTRLHPSQQPDQWKRIGDRNGLQVYRERGFVKGNAVKVNVLGQLTGSLEDVLLGLYAATNGSLKTQRSIMHSDYLDTAVLHVIDEDPYSEDDTGFSFQFAGLKWMACAPSGKLVHKRDLCWHEELGRTRDTNGDEVGYLVMQSHSVGGKSRSWSADAIMTEMWLGVASALDCAKAKRLSKLVSGKEVFITSAQSKTCDICDSKLKMLKTNQNCKICGKNVCDRCRMTKMIYPSRNTGNFPCSYFFCKPCLSDAKEKLYGRTTARVSFHSEDSSGRSGSNRSGSPSRYSDSESESDSTPEPEPVDVFEQDKLKYINSFRSNDVSRAVNSGAGSTGATSSSNGSSEQENLMERLMQINMAAEATYLMAKYNSNIQDNASR
ncbi:hypothetical protein BBO99_00005832 [Phytophthora kernoviae]|uniref:FYVE-type domain-containing protein n=2 Tax=Phytophthora kernoviae TaxID=325452 RepID=A0A3R7KIJ2_9STRA|nr:hypothetical protein G195_006723 [Phytophthora kernoviae 00238/432]KAG2522490.1 hypothetical protein JM16_005636 [Phytophthora kernoviae]KAG2524108.1 hypothetical protein JM18_005524 [Phytophthora kernoviae]RLN20432.1 hypothetical protein BBI17_005394 [Phytophthora kernoviae]RLN78644.1 hypothetical protein BBO99_00005832 [Phytophthora kernoviae]